jgi:uncharacterized membrane protein
MIIKTDIILNYIYFIILLFIIDLIWLSQPLHIPIYTQIQKSSVIFNKLAAILFYLFAPIGFFIFIKPLSNNKKLAFNYGIIMGFLMYMTYDFTNKAIFTDYPWDYAIKDIIWGCLLYGVVSYIMF